MSLKRLEPAFNVDLRRLTAIKIGGRAKHLFIAHDPDDLGEIVNNVGPAFHILGKGSNILAKDGLLQTPVIKLGAGFSYLKESGVGIDVGASTPLSHLIGYCLKNNLGGLENLAGIPATVGGLLIMNASSFGSNIGFCLKEVRVMDKKGSLQTLPRDKIIFGYRHSSLKDYIVLGAQFFLSPGAAVKEKVNYYLKRRIQTQDFTLPSCGCVFKNPANFSSGFLIDSCGFKGVRKGGAAVSLRHANFMVNLGYAAYSDVDFLIAKIKDRVYKNYSIILEEEIERWI